MSHLPPYVSLQYADNPLETLISECKLSDEEACKARELAEAKLPPLVRPDTLSYIFGVSHGIIVAMSRFPDTYYRVYTVSKRSGGTRQIEAPRRFLKIIQKWINSYILLKRELLPAVTGFVHGKNIFTNAKAHLPSKNLMVVDIEDFFPSIHRQKIARVFREFGFPVDVVRLLTGLCTYERRLPQGAPTSPLLSNIAFRSVDEALQVKAHKWGCVYTRYADDLAFSGDRVFSIQDVQEVSGILQEAGFSVNYQKTRIIGSGGRQILAGLIVNQKGLPLRKKRMQWRSLFHKASINPNEYVGQSSILKGIASFVNQYDKELAQEYLQIANHVAELE